ncbi:MAG: protease HtpX [Gemmatimonadales bacterium]|nr:MAG: protease HtpX [Gemmatimonadales bacterium]
MSYVKVTFLMAALTAFLVLLGGALGGQQLALTFFIMALALNLGMYWFSASAVLRMYRAQVIDRDQAPELWDMVDRLRKQADLPMPTVAIAPQEQPNAFATGRNHSNAVVCVTAGLLRAMDRRELEGVIAHELAHIKHRHMLVSTLAAAMAGAITYVAYFGAFFGGDRNPIVGLLTILLAPVAAAVLQMAISRTNEFQADRTGAEIAGSPDGLASALERLEAMAGRIPMDVNQAGASLAIVNPLKANMRGRGGMSRLFSTHPPTEDRIAALRELRGTF